MYSEESVLYLRAVGCLGLFLVLSCLVLYVSWLFILYQANHLQISSPIPSIGHPFILLIVSFAVQTFLFWCFPNSLFLLDL